MRFAASTEVPKWKSAMMTRARIKAVIWLAVRLLAKMPNAIYAALISARPR